MLNSIKYEAIRNQIENDIKTHEAEIASWKAVGKNYKTRKDGKPLADICKSFDGVDGVQKVRCVRNQRDSNWWSFYMVNSQGCDLTFDKNFYPSTMTVEIAIQDKIAFLESEIARKAEMLSNLEGIIGKCDEAASALLSVCAEKSGMDKQSTWVICLHYLRSVLDEYGMFL